MTLRDREDATWSRREARALRRAWANFSQYTAHRTSSQESAFQEDAG